MQKTNARIEAVNLRLVLIYTGDGKTRLESHLKHKIPKDSAVALVEDWLKHQKPSGKTNA